MARKSARARRTENVRGKSRSIQKGTGTRRNRRRGPVAENDLGPSADAIHLVQRIALIELSSTTFDHRWVSEGERWKELAFSLLARSTRKPESEVRMILDHLWDLRLLEVDLLSGLRDFDRSGQLGSASRQRIRDVLIDGGVADAEADSSIAALSEAAQWLAVHFGGKVQLYFRSYGEQMLRDLRKTTAFSTLNSEDVQYVFTYWLQNVLGMPLSLHAPEVGTFCDEHGITPSALIGIADALDLNVAVLDDILASYAARSQHPRAQGSLLKE